MSSDGPESSVLEAAGAKVEGGGSGVQEGESPEEVRSEAIEHEVIAEGGARLDAERELQSDADEGRYVDMSHQPVGRIGEGYDLGPRILELDVTNNRLRRIERLEQCTAMERLVLRQNEIELITGLGELRNLVELDLYMNEIRDLPEGCFQALTKLERLDLSFNQIRDLTKLRPHELPLLKELYLISNKITAIDGLERLTCLELLELGDNRIRVIEKLDAQAALRSLWLGRNKIARLENFGALKNLRILSLQSNRIVKLENLEPLEQLEELYLSHNGVEVMEGLGALLKLRILDLGANRVSKLAQVGGLPLLEELWMNNNLLESFDDLQQLTSLAHLATVYLEGNPLQRDPSYAQRVLSTLPRLQQLDALPVSRYPRAPAPSPI
mmetsp:Transcript_5088/g.13666  ORF Transcript_5088/g.13666 Transcript_5088/m.13666 type:complete len:384 (-) Transcript_5088:249-1400(-)